MKVFNSRKSFFVVIVSLSLLLVFASTAVVKADSIKIGAVLPLTGWAAAEGTHISLGAKMGVDKINAEGGVAGKKLELFLEDGAADPSVSLGAAQKLITREKVYTSRRLPVRSTR